MKLRHIKMFGIPYYARETKRFPWSKWKITKNDVGQVIPFRRLTSGKYEPEWRFTKPDE